MLTTMVIMMLTVITFAVASTKMVLRCGPSSKPLQHLERNSALPKARQRAVIDVIEATLAPQGR